MDGAEVDAVEAPAARRVERNRALSMVPGMRITSAADTKVKRKALESMRAASWSMPRKAKAPNSNTASLARKPSTMARKICCGR